MKMTDYQDGRYVASTWSNLFRHWYDSGGRFAGRLPGRLWISAHSSSNPPTNCSAGPSQIRRSLNDQRPHRDTSGTLGVIDPAAKGYKDQNLSGSKSNHSEDERDAPLDLSPSPKTSRYGTHSIETPFQSSQTQPQREVATAGNTHSSDRLPAPPQRAPVYQAERDSERIDVGSAFPSPSKEAETILSFKDDHIRKASTSQKSSDGELPEADLNRPQVINKPSSSMETQVDSASRPVTYVPHLQQTRKHILDPEFTAEQLKALFEENEMMWSRMSMREKVLVLIGDVRTRRLH